MNEHKTISDSKREFHLAFPYVIPPIYRRVVDELLVELHLLSHQKNFKVDTLFSLGLSQLFHRFTNGYKPEDQLEKLFESLCRSNGYDPMLLKKKTERSLNLSKNINIDDIKNYIKDKNSINRGVDIEELFSLNSQSKHYSRITAVGIYTIATKLNEKISTDKKNIINTSLLISELIGFSKERVEKDLNLYKSNIEKLTQALELIKETSARVQQKQMETKNSSRSKSDENESLSLAFDI